VSEKLPSALRILALLFSCLVVLAYALYNEKSFVEMESDYVNNSEIPNGIELAK